MMKDELILHICGDQTIHMEIVEKGIARTKYIDPDTLLECIKSSIYSKTQVESGLLPQNTLFISISAEENTKHIVLDYSDGYSNIVYMKTNYEHFPLPRLIFGFVVTNSGRVSSIKIGVPANEKRLTEDTKMYYYPFSNVSTFSLCVGSNSLPDVKFLQSLQNYPDFILGLPDNDDHYDIKHNKPGMSHRDLLEHLRDKDTAYYYDHILVPMPNTRLKDFL